MASILDYFPMQEVRAKQERALTHIDAMAREGYRDIVLAAPTGTGKSAIGVAICNWADSEDAEALLGRGVPGGFYTVTQKMLQDQLEADIARYRLGFNHAVSLKSAASYDCRAHGTCGLGLLHGKKRECIASPCTYYSQKRAFMSAAVGITNYPYLFTERTFSGKLLSRRVLVADECHTLENQVLHFVDLSVSPKLLTDYAPMLSVKDVPNLTNMDQFVRFLEEVYLPAVEQTCAVLLDAAVDGGDPKLMKKALDADNHRKKTKHGVETYLSGESDWVFWQEDDREGRKAYIARPTEAAPFAPDLIGSAGTLRIYMSAYPGVKDVFCRSLGLDPEEVGWISLSTTFPPANRPVRIVPVGSLSRENKDRGMPSVLRACTKLADKHLNEKGLIHCHSYALGEAIYAALLHSPAHRGRLLFPRAGEERERVYKEHRESPRPTIIISPSMTEGYDFADDAARWQIIAKVPYAYLGDRQVMAKKEKDPDWYLMETVKTIVQAAGRIVRSDHDHGVTYILDSDFLKLWARCQNFFPKWFRKAVKMPRLPGARV